MLRARRTFIVLALIATLIASATLPCVARAGERLDVSYVPSDTIFGAVIHPSRILQSQPVQGNPMVAGMVGQLPESLGFDPNEVEQLLAMVGMPEGEKEPNYGLVFRFAAPCDLESALPAFHANTTEDTLDGKTYRRGTNSKDPSLYMADERTVLMGTDAMLRKMLANHKSPAAGTMSSVLGRYDDSNDVLAILLLKPLRPMIAAELAKDPPPPEMADAAKIPELMDTFGLKLNLTGRGQFMLSARCKDEAAATELERIVNHSLDALKEQISEQVSSRQQDGNPQQAAMAAMILEKTMETIDKFRPVRNGSRLEVVNEGQEIVATSGIITAMLMPAIQAAREAARRAQSVNKMRQIAIAMQNYHDDNVKLPARAILDKRGKPLLSWRVQLLPYLDQKDLYEQFHLDEPWDSPHNKKLIDKMPDVFRNPNIAVSGKTNYLVPVAPGSLFESDYPESLSGVADGLVQTVMLVEADKNLATVWTKPDDWRVNMANPMAGVGKLRHGTFLVLCCDGSVRGVPTDISPETWKAMLTYAGREVIRE